ncbi:cadherin-7-like [Sinocyclocheilus rhinocerous]|uniref:cadherin-7-like n=1 Tax=Sinocyclocheilus rhinocerous TaxID=307959 RepID=UPI0007B9EFFC|nr:PREDICTED: cadherin-7-like [Sinocyclocheilus rhinocerous]
MVQMSFLICSAVWLLTVNLWGPRSADGAPDRPHHDPKHSWDALQRQKRNWVWNQFFVLEEYTGTDPLYVGKLHSDVDKADGNVRYVLTGDGASSIFTIDEKTGDIHATKRLDREEQGYYTLRAQAVDRETNAPMEDESEFIVKVQDINDNEPKFLDGPYTAGVPEMSPLGTMVVQVTATDADDPTYGNSARVVYSIIHGHPYFSVEPKTGIDNKTSVGPDNLDPYLLKVAVDVIAEPSHQYSVLESVPVPSVVAKLKAADADIDFNAEMDYYIIDGDAPGVFNITTDEETQEGVIFLQRPLDYETKSSFSLKIEATNRNVDPQFLTFGPFSDTAAVKVIVEDVNEPPVFSPLISRMVVSEAARVGAVIGTVSARDPDSSSSAIRYSIDRNTDLERFFNVDALTGVISTAKALDRELNSAHNITIFATENQDPSQVGRGIALITVMDINDNAPVFAIEYETLLCENAAPGQVIQTISAVDKDEPLSGHRFYFSLAFSAANNDNFTLRDNKDNTASVLTKRAGFRRQEQSLYMLPVLIVDSGSPALSSTNTLSVRVCDCGVNGVPQACGAVAFSLPAGLSTGALLAILGCIITLLVLMLLIMAMRRRRKTPLFIEDERDVRENIVRYDDEGGGEEDTEAFDMVTLRNLNIIRDSKVQDVSPESASVYPYSASATSRTSYKTLPDNIVFQEFIWDRLKVTDVDPSAPPYDSLQMYVFEGNGSVAESLSTLESPSSGSEQSYEDLSDWGPRFKKLADLYGNLEGSGIFS